MAQITAQVSIYPLRQARLSPVIEAVLTVFQSHRLECQPGAMSTMIAGAEDEVLVCLTETFNRAASYGDVVMNVTLSNACRACSTRPSGR